MRRKPHVFPTDMVSQSQLAVDKLVIVRYEGELLPGRITKVNQVGAHVWLSALVG